jgi:hypothetical protein
MKRVAVGAHLHRQDIEPLAGAAPIGDLWLSGFEVADDQPLGDRALLLSIAAIRDQLLQKATFIAIRYGYAFTTAAEAMERCAAHLPKWKDLLEAHRRHCEMTLKIPATVSRPRPDRHHFASGAGYLKALHEATQAASIDDRFRAEVERLIIPGAVEHRWIHRDNTALELALLVGRDDVEKIKNAGEELKRSMSSTPFLLSGPWPLEVFAE